MKATLYTGSIGINNKVPSHRLSYNKESGVSALEDATDVLISRTGEIVSKKGTTEIEAGDFQSVFPGKDWGLVAKNRTDDTAIYQVVVSESGVTTLNGIWSDLTKGATLDFCMVNGAVFYTNGFTTGMITKDAVRVRWVESIWPDDKTTKGFIAPPPSDHLCYNAGRIYFSRMDEGKHVVNYTVFAHLGLFDPATNGEEFPSKIIAMVPAADGLYVSDQEAIYFLAGLNPHEWTSRKVTDYPAKEWGKFHGTVNPSFWGFETNVPSSLMATENGPLLCMPGGQTVNLIDKNITMPDCPDSGAIVVFDETLVIQSHEDL